MFSEIPAADVYLLKLIIYDWNDEESVQILSNARKSGGPNARIFVIEHVVPGPQTPHFSKLFDIHMLCWGTGQERTEEQYQGLLEAAGWRYQAAPYAGRADGDCRGGERLNRKVDKPVESDREANGKLPPGNDRRKPAHRFSARECG